MTAKRIEISAEEAHELLDRAKKALPGDDYQIIKGLIDTHLLVLEELAQKNTSIKKLRKMIFGDKTEKTGKLRPKKTAGQKETKKTKGHGKNGAADYAGEHVAVGHQTLQHCGPCPACVEGRLYRLSVPGVLVRITGAAPLTATLYELEKLRCNICGKVFTADLPALAGSQKYDESAAAILALLRYDGGFALNRIAKLQTATGTPLAPSTCWEVIEKMADRIHPAYTELIRQAAQGDVIHNDDTTMKIQDVIKENRDAPPKSSRTGTFTTGILSILDDRKIALFFTGRQHAGENIAKVLAQRQNGLAPPIQMCDALSRNVSEKFQTILANCLTHGRRNFVDVAENFPDDCLYVIETLGKVYHHEAIAVERGMTPAQRLHFHQTDSGPLMDELHCWLGEQIDDEKVEPNSGLGQAIKYMRNHWQELTLFLRVQKAPLDNNICERALKMAILHRKNSLFYKTEHGAYIGDLFMSIIHTCALAKINPFDYLTTLQKNTSALFANPSSWMPWNYKENFTSSPC